MLTFVVAAVASDPSATLPFAHTPSSSSLALHCSSTCSIIEKVPTAQAEAVVDALEAAGQEATYERVVGADHLFDRAPASDMDLVYDWAVKILK